MNCKPGDMAIIVGGELGNEGGLLRVIGTDELCWGDEWLCEALSPLNSSQGYRTVPGTKGYCEDKFLRPIRPGDISDEEVRDLYAPNTTKETT